jgi:hypothetical protein
MQTVSGEMSTEYPKISIRLQELMNQVNNSFPSIGEATMAAYNQALEEGYTPRQAKNILYNNVHFLDERTIRRYSFHSFSYNIIARYARGRLEP